ncbi:hypothetical protein E5288_WYG009794 [Bos mutus]|uniref:Uncharacterized protein n=1 Tax=Bos mutus TaxID=72004 RepID=A0A6B0R5B0_9CETA|nr:hypothetical protein [Bos mutus]
MEEVFGAEMRSEREQLIKSSSSRASESQFCLPSAMISFYLKVMSYGTFASEVSSSQSRFISDHVTSTVKPKAALGPGRVLTEYLTHLAVLIKCDSDSDQEEKVGPSHPPTVGTAGSIVNIGVSLTHWEAAAAVDVCFDRGFTWPHTSAEGPGSLKCDTLRALQPHCPALSLCSPPWRRRLPKRPGSLCSQGLEVGLSARGGAALSTGPGSPVTEPHRSSSDLLVHILEQLTHSELRVASVVVRKRCLDT